MRERGLTSTPRSDDLDVGNVTIVSPLPLPNNHNPLPTVSVAVQVEGDHDDDLVEKDNGTAIIRVAGVGGAAETLSAT